MTATIPILQMQNLTLSYGDINALSDFSIDLNKGEIHALVGEHRSGKSSIAKILGGMTSKGNGSILLQGKRIDPLTPASSKKNGIGIIYQDTNLIPSLNAVENIYAGRFVLGRFRTINQKKMHEQVEDFLSRWKISINLKVPVNQLSLGEQYKIELIRAIFFNPEILVFDEISNKLNADEIEMAYSLILELKKNGKSILYISNNMNEIFEFADRVSVLKNGTIISTQNIRSIDKVGLIDLTYSFANTREQLRKKNEELYLYKKYNEDIINNLPLGMIILAQDTSVYLTNKPALEILAQQNKQPIISLHDLLAGFDRDLQQDLLHQVNKKEYFRWEEVEYAKGQYLDVTVFPFRDENYVFIGTILLIEDISKDYYFKNYLIQTERISSIAELAAGVAHEVNNPLGIILNYVELLKRHQNDDYSQDKISLIQGELNRIKEIIGSLLSFNRLNETPLLTLDVTVVLRNSLLLVSHQFKDKGLKIECLAPEQAVLIAGNENRLKQVFLNLIINASEAMSRGGTLIIEVHLYQEEGFTEISFKNNGKQIPEENLPKIFNPFYTTKEGTKNTGLGLSICQHIVEAHHGIISCESVQRQTVFRLRLPLSQEEPKISPALIENLS